MIGESTAGHYYIQNNTLPGTQDIHLKRIENHSDLLSNGEFITMQNLVRPPAREQQQPTLWNGRCLQSQSGEEYRIVANHDQPQHNQSINCSNILSSGHCATAILDDTPSPHISINDLSNDHSDASTVDGELPDEQKCTYLESLNSDNLMQFSQQSVLDMILKDQLQKKPNVHVLPTCDEFDNGNYNFKLNIPSQSKQTGWKYSEDLDKIFIRMNDILTIEAIYTPQFPVQQLRIRTFICFVKEVSEPVLRCQNHLSKDCEPLSTKRESILRCENPNAEYSGTADGKSIQTRFSVSVPLSLNTQDNKTVKQTIALKFMCQNSCIGRKETCIIFLLEGMSGVVYSQRVLKIRVCSCPKRDKNLEEKNARKRKSENDIFHDNAKVRKSDSLRPTTSFIKEENNCSDYEIAKHFDVQRTASGGFRLLVELSTKEVLLSSIDFMYAKECANVFENSSEAERAKQHIRKLKRLRNVSEAFH